MTSSIFYRDQASEQQVAADAATLDNVRDRCRRASTAWTALAIRSERADAARTQNASNKLLDGLSENPDRGCTTVPSQFESS